MVTQKILNAGKEIKKRLLGNKALLENWQTDLKKAIEEKKEINERFETEIIPYLRQAHEQGFGLRELAKITGISHATIASILRNDEEKRLNVKA